MAKTKTWIFKFTVYCCNDFYYLKSIIKIENYYLKTDKCRGISIGTYILKKNENHRGMLMDVFSPIKPTAFIQYLYLYLNLRVINISYS